MFVISEPVLPIRAATAAKEPVVGKGGLAMGSPEVQTGKGCWTSQGWLGPLQSGDRQNGLRGRAHVYMRVVCMTMGQRVHTWLGS